MRNSLQRYLLILLCAIAASCNSSYKKIAYFQSLPDTIQVGGAQPIAAYADPLIRPDDILSVTVQTVDLRASAPINESNTGHPSNGDQKPLPGGYLVDKEGFIELPVAGKVRVGGLTTQGAKEAVRKAASVYFKEPVVNVRFANFRVTVLGEVSKPATYVLPNEKVTLLEALGMAGDLTIYGKRENVLLIREQGTEKKFVRFNLNETSLFTYPYYYLQPGDVVYVEPGRAKAAASDVGRNRDYSLVASILTVAATVTAILITRSNDNR